MPRLSDGAEKISHIRTVDRSKIPDIHGNVHKGAENLPHVMDMPADIFSRNITSQVTLRHKGVSRRHIGKVGDILKKKLLR
jgi:hypothetical protein